MIKLIISDFDGVLLDLKKLHFDTLNKALASIDQKYVITQEEHVKTFDGLSTKAKLKILADLKNFPLDKAPEVNELKQKFTLESLDEFDDINQNIYNVVKRLKDEGYLFYVASNAVRATVDAGLKKLGIDKLVDKIYSNEDVKNQKPNPAIYLKCMIEAGVSPNETVIIEDSKHGRESAIKSGAEVCDVDHSFDFTYDRIKTTINRVKTFEAKWTAKNSLNVVIPMAGLGKRFADAGYKLPKPIIDVNGKPMIRTVIENLNIDANYIFVVQKEHYEKYNLQLLLEIIAPGCKILQVDGLTEGPACTILHAKNYINNDMHLLTVNSDQFIEWDSCDFMYKMLSSNTDGGIMTFHKENDIKWSYAKLDENGFVCDVKEKKPISNKATTGYYYWNKGSDFIKYAEQMISANDRTNNEFYVAPAYNYAIKEGKKIITYDIDKMWGLGTPEDLEYYIKNKR